MSKSAKTILAVVLLLVVAAAAVFAYFQWGPPAQKRAAEAQRAALLAANQAGGMKESETSVEAAEGGENAVPVGESAVTAETTDTAEMVDAPAESASLISITVHIVHSTGTEKEIVIYTRATTLREALEQEGLIEGTESGWGLYVVTVDGETADDTLQQWWCFNDGEGNMLSTGVDSTYIQNGDRYEIVFTTGW